MGERLVRNQKAGGSIPPTSTTYLVEAMRFFKQFWLKMTARDTSTAPELLRAQQLIRAIDRGGVPLNPLRINHVARDLGLEVSRKARPEETIARIRQALQRSSLTW